MRNIKQEEEYSIRYRVYQEMIETLKGELQNTKWYEFKYKKFLTKEISHYEELLRQLDFEMLFTI